MKDMLMQINTSLLLLAVVAYLIGSLSFAVIVSRFMGLDDPRTYGSQNPGATNVLRSGNKKAAVLTLLFDALKGYFPVLLTKWYGPVWGFDDQAIAVVAFGAFAGHLWPVFFRFLGGKGVATALGVMFGVAPFLGLAAVGTWLIVAFVFRYSSLAALSASVLSPVIYFFGNQVLWETSNSVLLAVTAMSALLLMRHKDNIARLVAGQESKIGAKKETQPAENGAS